MPVEHRPPGNQRKIARAFDQRIAPARHVDGAGETPFDPLVEPRLDKGLCAFLGKLAGDTRQFTPLKRRDPAATLGETAILFTGKHFPHQPLQPPTHGTPVIGSDSFRGWAWSTG